MLYSLLETGKIHIQYTCKRFIGFTTDNQCTVPTAPYIALSQQILLTTSWSLCTSNTHAAALRATVVACSVFLYDLWYMCENGIMSSTD